MKPAVSAISRNTPLNKDAGFSLIEIIVSLVIVGILASIASMGVVSAISGYAVVKENVSLSQKIQLAATRISRELLELTAIDNRDDSRPSIVFHSATGRRHAIAKVNETIRLYDIDEDQPGMIDDAYLESSGDILTDRVEAFTLNYFQGVSIWDGSDIRDLSTIQISLNLIRTDIAGSTVNVTTRVHLRNNDNYGGSPAVQPVTAATGDQYACFISAAQSRPVVLVSTWTGRLLTWAPGLIALFVFCGVTLESILAAKRKSVLFNKSDGSVLIGMIITILVFAALGAALVPMISSSQLQRTAAGRSDQAYYMAESGLRYAASQYLSAISEAQKYAVLNDLHGVTHRLQGNQGAFTVAVNPYYFLVDVDPANTTTLITRFYGDLADKDAFTAGGGSLSIDDSVYSFTSASIAGQQITFFMSTSLTVPVDTPVYPVAQAIAQTVNDNDALALAPGAGKIFPQRNGSFVLGDDTYTYRENGRDTNTLLGIKRTDGSGFSEFTLTADTNIRLKKFVKITSTGIVGSGDMMATRDIVYHVQIPEEKEPQRISLHEKFDNLDKWNESLLGAHEIDQLAENNVLRVSGISQSGVDTPSASLIALNAGAVQFNPDDFDTQVKIGYDPVIPDYYTAGISFRLAAGGDKTYGLSFQRSAPSGDTSDEDHIYNGLKPFDADHVLAIILWQSTGSNHSDKQWLAYKKISAVNIPPQLNDFISEDDWSGGPLNLFSSTAIASLPMLPCDFKNMKLELNVDCVVGSCTSLMVNWDGEMNWTPVDLANKMETDVTENQGKPYAISFRIDSPPVSMPAPQITVTIDVVADNFDIQNATLLTRFSVTNALEFIYNGEKTIEPGDRIFQQSGASASVYGYPLISPDDPNQGTLLLKDVNGPFVNGNLSVIGKTDVATLNGVYEDQPYHFIKAYYGTEFACGNRSDDQLDRQKGANQTNPDTLNWPPDEGTPWTSERDNFTLIQWDAHNPDVKGEASVSLISHKDFDARIDYRNTIVKITRSPLTDSGSTLGLHTFGKGSPEVYFDDFGYQSFVDQPVVISQPIQY
jgi:prepilin-type N-terminal cleavage/methylation domain-containing protein